MGAGPAGTIISKRAVARPSALANHASRSVISYLQMGAKLAEGATLIPPPQASFNQTLSITVALVTSAFAGLWCGDSANADPFTFLLDGLLF